MAPYDDTDPAAMAVWLELLRGMKAAEKLDRVFDLMALGRDLAIAGERLRDPDAGEREWTLRAAARLYGADLIERAYGWRAERGRGAGGA